MDTLGTLDTTTTLPQLFVLILLSLFLTAAAAAARRASGELHGPAPGLQHDSGERRGKGHAQRRTVHVAGVGVYRGGAVSNRVSRDRYHHDDFVCVWVCLASALLPTGDLLGGDVRVVCVFGYVGTYLLATTIANVPDCS